MGIECKTPEVDIEDDKMLIDILGILQPEDITIINTDHFKTPKEKEFEIYAALVRHGRSQEDAARIAKAMALDEK
ncbi:MAG: hypothetical protein HYV24_06720 [Deltaproteobacteria bacterium]|nr:hypothetical protein [Deltaproteobacteria bacterium]